MLRANRLWLFDAEWTLDDAAPVDDPRARLLATVAAGCAAAGSDHAVSDGTHHLAGRSDAIERAVADLATGLGMAADPVARGRACRAQFRSDALLRRATSIDDGRNGVTVTVNGAVDTVLPFCTLFLDAEGRGIPLTHQARLHLRRAAAREVAKGGLVLAVAHRAVGVGRPAPLDRREAETDLVLIGLVVLTIAPAPPRSAEPTEAPRAPGPGAGLRRA